MSSSRQSHLFIFLTIFLCLINFTSAEDPSTRTIDSSTIPDDTNTFTYPDDLPNTNFDIDIIQDISIGRLVIGSTNNPSFENKHLIIQSSLITQIHINFAQMTYSTIEIRNCKLGQVISINLASTTTTTSLNMFASSIKVTDNIFRKEEYFNKYWSAIEPSLPAEVINETEFPHQCLIKLSQIELREAATDPPQTLKIFSSSTRSRFSSSIEVERNDIIYDDYLSRQPSGFPDVPTRAAYIARTNIPPNTLHTLKILNPENWLFNFFRKGPVNLDAVSPMYNHHVDNITVRNNKIHSIQNKESYDFLNGGGCIRIDRFNLLSKSEFPTDRLPDWSRTKLEKFLIDDNECNLTMTRFCDSQNPTRGTGQLENIESFVCWMHLRGINVDFGHSSQGGIEEFSVSRNMILLMDKTGRSPGKGIAGPEQSVLTDYAGGLWYTNQYLYGVFINFRIQEKVAGSPLSNVLFDISHFKNTSLCENGFYQDDIILSRTWYHFGTVRIFDSDNSTSIEGIHDFDFINMSGNVLGKPYPATIHTPPSTWTPNEINSLYTDSEDRNNHPQPVGLMGSTAITVYWFVCVAQRRIRHLQANNNYLKTKLIAISAVQRFVVTEAIDFGIIEASDNHAFTPIDFYNIDPDIPFNKSRPVWDNYQGEENRLVNLDTFSSCNVRNYRDNFRNVELIKIERNTGYIAGNITAEGIVIESLPSFNVSRVEVKNNNITIFGSFVHSRSGPENFFSLLGAKFAKDPNTGEVKTEIGRSGSTVGFFFLTVFQDSGDIIVDGNYFRVVGDEELGSAGSTSGAIQWTSAYDNKNAGIFYVTNCTLIIEHFFSNNLAQPFGAFVRSSAGNDVNIGGFVFENNEMLVRVAKGKTCAPVQCAVLNLGYSSHSEDVGIFVVRNNNMTLVEAGKEEFLSTTLSSSSSSLLSTTVANAAVVAILTADSTSVAGSVNSFGLEMDIAAVSGTFGSTVGVMPIASNARTLGIHFMKIENNDMKIVGAYKINAFCWSISGQVYSNVFNESSFFGDVDAESNGDTEKRNDLRKRKAMMNISESSNSNNNIVRSSPFFTFNNNNIFIRTQYFSDNFNAPFYLGPLRSWQDVEVSVNGFQVSQPMPGYVPLRPPARAKAFVAATGALFVLGDFEISGGNWIIRGGSSAIFSLLGDVFINSIKISDSLHVDYSLDDCIADEIFAPQGMQGHIDNDQVGYGRYFPEPSAGVSRFHGLFKFNEKDEVKNLFLKSGARKITSTNPVIQAQLPTYPAGMPDPVFTAKVRFELGVGGISISNGVKMKFSLAPSSSPKNTNPSQIHFLRFLSGSDFLSPFQDERISSVQESLKQPDSRIRIADAEIEIKRRSIEEGEQRQCVNHNNNNNQQNDDTDEKALLLSISDPLSPICNISISRTSFQVDLGMGNTDSASSSTTTKFIDTTHAFCPSQKNVSRLIVKDSNLTIMNSKLLREQQQEPNVFISTSTRQHVFLEGANFTTFLTPGSTSLDQLHQLSFLNVSEIPQNQQPRSASINNNIFPIYYRLSDSEMNLINSNNGNFLFENSQNPTTFATPSSMNDNSNLFENTDIEVSGFLYNGRQYRRISNFWSLLPSITHRFVITDHNCALDGSCTPTVSRSISEVPVCADHIRLIVVDDENRYKNEKVLQRRQGTLDEGNRANNNNNFDQQQEFFGYTKDIRGKTFSNVKVALASGSEVQSVFSLRDDDENKKVMIPEDFQEIGEEQRMSFTKFRTFSSSSNENDNGDVHLDFKIVNNNDDNPEDSTQILSDIGSISVLSATLLLISNFTISGDLSATDRDHEVRIAINPKFVLTKKNKNKQRQDIFSCSWNDEVMMSTMTKQELSQHYYYYDEKSDTNVVAVQLRPVIKLIFRKSPSTLLPLQLTTSMRTVADVSVIASTVTTGNTYALTRSNRMRALNQFGDCEFSDVSALDPTEAPLMLDYGSQPGRYQRGAILGNLVITLICFVLLFAPAVYHYHKQEQKVMKLKKQYFAKAEKKRNLLLQQQQHQKKENKYSKIKKNKNDEDENFLIHQNNKDFKVPYDLSLTLVDFCRKFWLPGHLQIPWNGLLQGSLSASTALYRHSYNKPNDFILATISSLASFFLLIWPWYAFTVQLRKNPQVQYLPNEVKDSNVSDDDNDDDDENNMPLIKKFFPECKECSRQYAKRARERDRLKKDEQMIKQEIQNRQQQQSNTRTHKFEFRQLIPRGGASSSSSSSSKFASGSFLFHVSSFVQQVIPQKFVKWMLFSFGAWEVVDEKLEEKLVSGARNKKENDDTQSTSPRGDDDEMQGNDGGAFRFFIDYIAFIDDYSHQGRLMFVLEYSVCAFTAIATGMASGDDPSTAGNISCTVWATITVIINVLPFALSFGWQPYRTRRLYIFSFWTGLAISLTGTLVLFAKFYPELEMFFGLMEIVELLFNVFCLGKFVVDVMDVLWFINAETLIFPVLFVDHVVTHFLLPLVMGKGSSNTKSVRNTTDEELLSKPRNNKKLTTKPPKNLSEMFVDTTRRQQHKEETSNSSTKKYEQYQIEEMEELLPKRPPPSSSQRKQIATAHDDSHRRVDRRNVVSCNKQELLSSPLLFSPRTSSSSSTVQTRRGGVSKAWEL